MTPSLSPPPLRPQGAPTRRRGRLALVLAAALLGSPVLAGATQLQALDLSALVSRSAQVLVGVVESQRAAWSDARHSSIVTDVRVRVTRGVRGARAGDVITVRRLGGSVDGIGMRVAGEASFAAGEEILLFAEQRGADLFAVGMSQGKLHIDTDKGRKVVSGSLAGAELIPGTAPALAQSGPRPLEDLLLDIAQVMQAQAARKKDAR